MEKGLLHLRLRVCNSPFFCDAKEICSDFEACEKKGSTARTAPGEGMKKT